MRAEDRRRGGNHAVAAIVIAVGIITVARANAGAPLPPEGSTLVYQGGIVEAVPDDVLRRQPKIHPMTARLLGDRPEGASIKAWVLFTDKGREDGRAVAAALADLAPSYNARALERRRLRRNLPGLVDEYDLPVSSAYIEAVKAAGARVHVAGKWINGVSVQATRTQIDEIAGLPFVKRIQPVRHGHIVEPTRVERVPADFFRAEGSSRSAEGSLDYNRSEDQLSQIDLISVHDLGYTGAGIVIGILDSGFRTDHEVFNQAGHVLDVVAAWDFVDGDGNVAPETGDAPGQHVHGTYILGTLGSYKPGDLIGAAFDASFILCKTEDTTAEYEAEEDNYVAGLEFIEANGGDVATSSLGYINWYTQSDLDGMTAVTTIAVNVATANGLHCCTAAGNGGHDSLPTTARLIAPADALRAITVGAVRSDEQDGIIATFSSDGPTADGRVKPEVLAQGYTTSTVSPDDTVSYRTANGTSLSTPLVAGVVACLTQAYPNWTVDQMRAYLFRSASDYVATGTYDPYYVRGYGIVNAFAALLGDCNENGIFDADELGSGAVSDCNGNGVPDECDLDYPDCNANRMPDECEVPASVTYESGELSPIGSGSPQSYTAVQPPPAASDVTLTFTAYADLSATAENIRVEINGTFVGTVFAATGSSDCADPPSLDALVVPAATFNDAVAGGDAVIRMEAAAVVDPNACFFETHIAVTVDYKAEGLVSDCNDTGVPDECETGDFDGDGAVTLSDLGVYANCLTGPCTAAPCEPALYADPCCTAADGDHDGDHDLADVAVFQAMLDRP